MDKFSLIDIKKMNYSDVYHYIYHNDNSSKQAIAAALGMSLPTITQHLNTLLAENLIVKCGQLHSKIGRKATAYSVVPTARISIGIEILEEYFVIIGINLKGEAIGKRVVDLSFTRNERYYSEVCQEIADFIEAENYAPESILGIGFGIQGLVSADGKEVIYGQILDCTGLRMDDFGKHLDYPCRFVHDVECAALVDLWKNQDISDAFYLSLGYHLGGKIIIQGEFHSGFSGISGIVEHMTLVPDGKECYCGKKGCVEAYCSVEALLRDGETLDKFFENKALNNKEYVQRFDTYLDNLAIAINNIHMLINVPVILGGHLSPYLEDADLTVLFNKVCSISAFPEEEMYISLGSREKNAIAIGAGLPFIKAYLHAV